MSQCPRDCWSSSGGQGSIDPLVQFTPYPVGGAIAQNTLDSLMRWCRMDATAQESLWGPETTSLEKRILQRAVRAVCDYLKGCLVTGAVDLFCANLRNMATQYIDIKEKPVGMACELSDYKSGPIIGLGNSRRRQWVFHHERHSYIFWIDIGEEISTMGGRSRWHQESLSTIKQFCDSDMTHRIQRWFYNQGWPRQLEKNPRKIGHDVWESRDEHGVDERSWGLAFESGCSVSILCVNGQVT